MKKPIFLSGILLQTLVSADPAVTLPPDGSTLGIGASGSEVTLYLGNPGNHPWLLKSTTDFIQWSAEGSHQVHNGSLSITLPKDGPRRYYRIEPGAAVARSAAIALDLPATPFNYAAPELPAHLLAQAILAQDNTQDNNRVTDAGATLGRVLFYDKRLSASQTISCSSCHQAEHGFSDPARFSTGFEGGLTDRNSMGLTNARYYFRRSFFWDERAATLEDQVLQPILNQVEMGMTLAVLNERIAAEPYYAELFAAAFGTPAVNSTTVSRALSQFVRSIVSGNSRYDQGVPRNFSNLTPQESQGRQIFTGGAGGCAACHGSDNFVPRNLIFNNGLESPYGDKGVGEVTGDPDDEGFFKVPSLRNIELTAPFMHDGRFATLEQVVDFYNAGVVNHPNLSPQLRNPPGTPGAGQPRRLNLNAGQKAALVAFLKTLTDFSVTTDPKFLDPFRYR